jgi:hypothetical protein
VAVGGLRDKRSARVLLVVGWGVAGADIDVDVDVEAACCEIAREMNQSWRRRVGWIGGDEGRGVPRVAAGAGEL